VVPAVVVAEPQGAEGKDRFDALIVPELVMHFTLVQPFGKFCGYG